MNNSTLPESFRDKQIAAITRVLSGENGGSKDQAWKVLVFDKFGRDVISSVMRVNDLFQNGVTIHMLLDSDRYAIDVPVVYFVRPTSDNLQKITRDLHSQLYESTSVNFVSPLPRQLLESFAAENVATASQITQVYDHYLNYVVSEANLFSLALPNIYSELASPKMDEDSLNAIVDQIVSGLFSVVVTQGEIPIIRCPRGNAAEMVAQKLDSKLRDHVNNLKLTTNPLSRPVLMILDRNIDLASMLQHSSNYMGLVHDVFESERGQIRIAKDNGSTESYDVAPSDFFWNQNSLLSFPEVAESMDNEVNRYKEEYSQITGGANINDMDSDASPTHLKKAISAIPKLTARKTVIDMHMNIATALVDRIKKRQLDILFEAEDGLDKQALLPLLKDEELSGTDKLRAYICVYLSGTLSAGEQKEYEGILTSKGVDLAALNYVKRLKDLSKMMALKSSAASAQEPQTSEQSFRNFASKLSSGKIGNLISNVKSYLPQNKDLPVTRIVSGIVSPSESGDITDDYLYFDPSVRGSSTKPPRKQAYNEAIVFVVGGANYAEYANLMDYGVKAGKKVVYGGTDVVKPDVFLGELAKLAN
ncbi:Protein sly1 [Yarrowia sp. C11]|nr:Protein sly1 [Yarrowia sp. E02]KAG5367546.1 Protein sly1 [Yarrowia sp. C11]